MAPFAAAFINRFGVRPVVVVAITMIALGILASLAMTQVWQLVALWGVIVGFGTGMVALVLGATIATRWFAERRGLVVGMLTASNATGQLIFLPLIAKLTQDHGWRTALVFVVAMLFVAGLIGLLALRDRPSDVGLAPYGARAIEPPPKQDLRLTAMMSSPLKALYAARASRTFWVLFATFYICGLSTNGLIQTHWIALCGDYGVAPVGAAGALAAIGAFDFFGTILSGWLSDRYDNRWLLFVYYGLRGLSLISVAVHGFLRAWTIGFRGLLRPRLGGDGSPDRAPDRRAFRGRKGEPHLRLDLHRPPARRGHRGVRRRRLAHRACDLSARALCRWRRLRDRGGARADDRAAGAESGRGRRRVDSCLKAAGVQPERLHVMPAKAGIQTQGPHATPDSRLRGNDKVLGRDGATFMAAPRPGLAFRRERPTHSRCCGDRNRPTSPQRRSQDAG
jgi:MFS family permease